MYPTKIPENMQYIFENADYLLSQEDYQLLTEKHNRAKNLKENNGAIYPGLTQSAVMWLETAYVAKNLSTNKLLMMLLNVCLKSTNQVVTYKEI